MSAIYYTRRNFLKAAGIGATSLLAAGCLQAAESLFSGSAPNFIIIFCDDLGYGDLGCFGSKKHRTVNIDKMAAEGIRLTSFYVTSGVCTPSRASLMTGCYPRCVNLHESSLGESVLFPVAKKGLNPQEITIAEVLKERGYATACIGKWHLGDQPQFLPTRQGFDYYFGIPYSNDMGTQQKGRHNPPLPLLHNETVIEAPLEQDTLTMRYTQQVIDFITANKDRPFFVYLAHTMPHTPVHASDKFRGKSSNGIYGDAVEEIDWSTGEILSALKKLAIDSDTLVVFTSDNGAARSAGKSGGSNLPLKGWKGGTLEGGMREPCVARWPGRIAAGKTCDELASTMDLLPTFAALAGAKPPGDRVIDGRDIWPLLAGKEDAKSPHEAFYYYMMGQLQAVRCGRWKLHLPLEAKRYNWARRTYKTQAKLYDLKTDIGETVDVAAEHPDVISRLLAMAQKAREDIGDNDHEGLHQRPAGMVVSPKPLVFSSE